MAAFPKSPIVDTQCLSLAGPVSGGAGPAAGEYPPTAPTPAAPALHQDHKVRVG